EQGLGYYYQPACAYIDGVVDRAEAAGVYLLPTIWTHAQLRDTDHTWGDGWWWNNTYQDVCSVTDFFVMDSGGETPQWRLQKNYYRYMIARWGYSRAIAGWVALCEIDGTEGFVDDSAQAASWCAAVRDYFRTNDKYRVNASNQYPMVASNLDSPSWGNLDLRATDTYTSQYNDVAIAQTVANQTSTMRGSGLPSFHAEFGGNVAGGASQPAHMHNGIWAGFSSGAAMTPLLWCDGYDFPMLADAGSVPQDPPITVNTAMRDHLQYLSEFAASVTYLGDAALEPIPGASVNIDDGNCRGWGMWLPSTATEYDRGFGWIQDTGGTMGGEIVDIPDVDPGDYLMVWYDVWTSGQDNISLSSVTVDASEVLTATIPTLAQSDIAFQFWPTAEAPTYVLMDETSSRAASGGAIVEWTTESEVDNLGFHVLRRPAARSRWERVTARMIPGRLTAVGSKTYRHLDLVAPGRYEYRIETVSTDGERERHGSREGITVEVGDEGEVASLVETAGLLAGRAAGACRAWRGRISTERRLRELAELPKGWAPRASSGRDDRARVRRVASSTTAGRPTAAADGRGAAPTGGARPSPGDVCVRTRGDGVFFVPAAALPCPPERARLTTGGVTSRPLEADPSGIWFFAADYRDAYTDTNATFVGPGRARTGTRGGCSAPAGLFAREACSVMADTARAEEDALFVSAATDAPGPWFSRAILWSGGAEHTVHVQVADLLQGATTLRVAVFGYSTDDAVDPDHELVVSVNDRAVADLFWDGRGYKVIEIPLEQGAIRDGANTIGLLTPLTESIPGGHGVIVDYIEIEYPRALSVAGGPLIVQVDERSVVEVAGLAAAEVWVVEIGPAGEARKVATAFRESGAGGYVARFRTRGGRYYVARPDQVRAPLDTRDAVIASVRAGTSYLAVGPEVFRRPAGDLLDARRAGGLSPAYVSLESAIDTYGHGRYGAGGVVNLVRELAPRYIVLVGDNCYDYLGREGKPVDPMVPAVLTRTRHDCQANADALYGDLDGDGTGVLVADDASKGQDFASAQDVVAASFPEVDWTKLYAGVHGDGAFIREALTRTVNSGADLVVYQGHGSSSRLGSSYPLLDLDEAARWTGAPVVYLSSCWGAYILRNTAAASSIAEALLRSQGGATAVIGSTAASTQGTQRALLADFLAAGLRESDCIGDALVAAQRKAARRASGITAEGARQDVLDAVHCYTVLGDPATAIVFGPWKELAGRARDGNGAAPPARPDGGPPDGRRGK
ncbi:MAG: C25 family cysteine peptidase, partial [Planctomycetota bacterium]